MSKSINLIVLITILSVGILSCGTDSPSNEEENSVDSLSMAIEDTVSLQSAISPKLIGEWKLVETRMGEEAFPSMGESTLTFTESRELISTSDDFPTETFQFYQEDGELSSDLWDARQIITNLDESELILSETIDGQEVYYVYQKVL